MSIPAKTLYDTCVVNVVNDFKTKFVAAATRGTTGHPQGAILVQSMTGWMDEAGKEVCAAALTLTVPVAGAPAQNTQFQAPAQLQAPSPFASSPFAAQLQPQQQQFAPPPFGGQQQFGQQQQQQQQAPQAGALKGVVSTLAECGIPGQTTRVPSNMMLPQGATCGMQCSKKGHTDIFYCSQPAKKPNPNTGTYCCTSHHSRQGGLDKDPGKKKSGKTSGGNIISAAQIQGLGRPTALPPGMGNNFQQQQQVASFMGQNPQFANNPMQNQPFNPQQQGQFGNQPFNPQQQNQFGQQPFNPQQQQNQPFNPQQSTQLINNVQGQIAGVPQQQQLPPNGGGINMTNMMAGQPPSAVPVSQFAPMGRDPLSGIPQAGGPFNQPPFGQQQYGQPQFQQQPFGQQPQGQIGGPFVTTHQGTEGDEDGSSSSSEEDESHPVEQVNHSQFAAAFGAAPVQQVQQQQPGPFGAAPQQPAFGGQQAGPFGGQQPQQSPFGNQQPQQHQQAPQLPFQQPQQQFQQQAPPQQQVFQQQQTPPQQSPVQQALAQGQQAQAQPIQQQAPPQHVQTQQPAPQQQVDVSAQLQNNNQNSMQALLTQAHQAPATPSPTPGTLPQ